MLRLGRQVHRPAVSCFFIFLVLCGFRHISTENVALGTLRSDDGQLGRPTASPVLSGFPCNLASFLPCCIDLRGDLRGCQGRPEGAVILTLDSPASHFTIELRTKRNTATSEERRVGK